MRTIYDPESDALYARFTPPDVVVEQTREVAPGVTIDLDANGQLVGVEVLSVRRRAAGEPADVD
jgi:uncharacterized protein YuzE